MSWRTFLIQQRELRETCAWIWPGSISINIQRVVDTFFLQSTQICVTCPGRVNLLSWNWEWFFFRHVVMNSRFCVMTTNEFPFYRPEVISGFGVILLFCRLTTIPVSWKFSIGIFTPCKLFTPQIWFSDFHDLFQAILPCRLRTGIWFFHTFWTLVFPVHWACERGFLTGLISQLLNICNLNVSFPDSPAIIAYQKTIPGKTFFPNWWSLEKSHVEMGWYSTNAPNRVIGHFNGSPNRFSQGVLPSAKRSWPFRK